jgi:hypothetical protein
MKHISTRSSYLLASRGPLAIVTRAIRVDKGALPVPPVVQPLALVPDEEALRRTQTHSGALRGNYMRSDALRRTQKNSGALRRTHSEALRRTQMNSEALRSAHSDALRSTQKHSEALRREALGCTQTHSDALRRTQTHSDALRRTQKHSDVIRPSYRLLFA